MKRPLLVCVLFFVIGIMCGRYFTGNAEIALFFALGAIVCAAVCIIGKSAVPAVFVLAMLAGFLRFGAVLPPDTVTAGEPASMTVMVLKQQGSGFIIETPDKTRLIMYTDADSDISPGDVLRVSGTPRRTEPRRNPGAFDERAYFAARGVFYKIYAADTELITRADTLYAWLNRISGKITRVFYTALPEKEAAVISSIITGDRSALPDDIKDLYSAGGIYHILAISGLHIGIIGLFLDALLRRVLSRRLAAAVVIAALVLYTLFTGASPSTVRAALILSVMLFGNIIFRIPDSLTSIAFAALCILLYSPYYLWDAGFLLSFAGVIGIVTLSSPLERLFALIGAKIPAVKPFFNNFWVQKSLTVSVAVNLAILPVCSDFLPRVPVYGIIVNLIVFPTFFLLVALGFAAGLIGLMFMPAAVFLCGGIFYLLRFYEAVLRFFTELPFSSILTGYIPPYIVIAYYVFLAAGAWYLLGLPDRAGRGKYAAAAGLALGAVIFLHAAVPRDLSVTMLDVGQGDAFVIKKDRFTAVIDGGGRHTADIGANTGARVVVPYLEYLGADRVNLVIVTHLDYDHAAGIIELLSEKRADIVCLPVTADENSEIYARITEAARLSGAAVRFISKGDSIAYGNIGFEFLHPQISEKSADGNENSIVLRLSYGDTSFLFTGDISSRIEEQLINSGVRADVLKLAHHGSRFSNSDIFIDAVSPKLAAVSYSAGNNYGFPAPEVTERLYERGISLFGTAERGAVIMKSNGRVIRVSVMINE